MAEDRTVVLRNIKVAASGDEYHLWASYNEDKDLVLSAQEFSFYAKEIFGDEEREYMKTIKNKDLSYLRNVLGISDEADILDYLLKNYAGERSFEFERLLDNKKVLFELYIR